MRFAQAAVVLLAVVTLVGCGKKAGEEPVAQPDTTATEGSAATEGTASSPAAPTAPEQDVLPGASSVRSSLASKDYDTAVGGLLALKRAAVTPEQNQAYMVLYDEVKFGLMDASATDPKAASALAALRAATAGR